MMIDEIPIEQTNLPGEFHVPRTPLIRLWREHELCDRTQRK